MTDAHSSIRHLVGVVKEVFPEVVFQVCLAVTLFVITRVTKDDDKQQEEEKQAVFIFTEEIAVAEYND